MPDVSGDDGGPVFEREVCGKERECVTEACGGWRDEAVETELMRGCSNCLRGQVVADRRVQLGFREADCGLYRARAQIEHVWHRDTTGDDPALQNGGCETFSVVEFVVDEMAVGLDDDAVARSAEVQHLEGAAFAPASAGGAGAKLLPPKRGVTLEDPVDLSWFKVRDRGEQVAVSHIDPAASRSIASSTSSYAPSASRSIGRRLSRLRLRPCSQISAPSRV